MTYCLLKVIITGILLRDSFRIVEYKHKCYNIKNKGSEVIVKS